jgi:hypothetical protein
LTKESLQELLSVKIRTEKVAIKDAKLRTLLPKIVGDDLVAHVYDVTYGVIKPTDNLVIIDDSIVRGTTLKNEYYQNDGSFESKKNCCGFIGTANSISRLLRN